MFELHPATAEMARIIGGVRDDHLDRATPCPEWTVRDLLAHIHQFTSVFADNARKNPIDPPSQLGEAWRTEIPDRLADLAAGWSAPDAWEGRVSAGGIDMPAADNAVVAAEELTVHAWDLARATDQDLQVDPAILDRVEHFFVLFSPDDDETQGPFGPVAPIPHDAVPGDAGRLDRLVARAGRDPRWT